MPKFSVKKPFTVFVAVVAILVLGVVAYTKMTPDLMPNMNLPYVLVMTSAPGSTPEKVETSITRPLEQSFATLDKIKSIRSVSNENYSVITLEFSEDVNMDTISVDILQNVDQVSASFEETVGTPYILKINPSLLPVAVTAVGMEGMDTAELSDFMEENIIPKLEGIEGVASTDASGLVDTKVNVVIDQDKIDKVNDKIYAALDKKFDEAKEEIDENQAKLDDKKREVESGKSKLSAGKNELAEQTSDAQAKIAGGTIELLNGRIELEKQMNLLNEKKTELTNTKNTLTNVQKSVNDATAAKEALNTGINGLKEAKAALAQIDEQEKAAMAAFNAQIDAIKANDALDDASKEAAIAAITSSEQYTQATAAFSAARAQINAQLSAAGTSADQIDATIAQYEQQVAQIDSGLKTIDDQLAAQNMKREDIPAAMEEIDKGLGQIEGGLAQMTAALTQIGAAGDQISEGQKQLDAQRTLGILQISEMTSALLVGESQLALANQQLEAGVEQYEQTRKDAYKQANMKEIITMDMVSQILSAENFAMPAGYISEDGTDYLVNVGDKITDEDEISDLMIADLKMDDLDPVYLKDVAEVFITDNSDEVYANIDGTNGVIITFTKQSTYATAAVSNSIREKLNELTDQYPGFHYAMMMDQGDYIYLIVNSILKSLLFGAIFAILILFVFLKDLRPTFITLCSIPVSVIFAVVLMYFSGVTINMISLSGLAIAVGMLVDNSVVVIENTFRLIGKGESAVKAAVAGASQVAGAIVSSTLTTICVFLPIVFVEGITKQIFTDLALTMTYSLLASLVIALTLVPAMSQGLLKNVNEKPDRFINLMLNAYEKVLTLALKFKPVTLLIALALLVVSAVLILARGYIFMPSMSGNQVTATVTLEEGATLADLREKTDKIVDDIRKMDNIINVGAMASGSNSSASILNGSSSGGPSASIYIMLSEDEKTDTNAMAEDIVALGDKYDCTVEASGDMMGGFSQLIGGEGITIHLFGEDLETMQKTAADVAEILKSVRGTANVSDGLEETDPAIKVTVDKEKAMADGLTVAQVFMELSSALTEEKNATNIMMDDGTDYDVIVKKGEDGDFTRNDLRKMTFKVKDREGEEKEVKLTDIATISDTEALQSIRRMDQKRYIDITSEIADGYNVTLVTDDAIDTLSKYQLAPGMSIEFEGANESIMKALKDLVLMILLGIVLVYLVMVAQFQSLKSPFIVMFTIPLAFTGGFLALLITGMEISVVSMMGFVMLTGIIVNNGIVLVDFINQLRMDGYEKTEALIEAGRTRMRPILMTTVTTILGLIVMALGTQTGSEMMQPVAIVCIGGLAYATLMTLIVIPVLYDIFNRGDIRVVRDEDLELTE